MNDTTNQPTGQGMTHRQVQRFEEMLFLARDIQERLLDEAREAKRFDHAALHEMQLWAYRDCLDLLHRYSEGCYGEPRTYPETEKK